MSTAARASAALTSKTDTTPKAFAISRAMDSLTYSAFLEEAEMLESLAQTDAPIRYRLKPPSIRFYAAIALTQLFLVSSVVAIVLLSGTTSNGSNEISHYVIWLVFSACATFFAALMALIYSSQRRRVRLLQARLRAMQQDASARGSRKRLEMAPADASGGRAAPPQLRTETDHRQSVLVRQASSATRAPSMTTIGGSGGGDSKYGRQRANTSSAAGEGCELTHFQTHLSGSETEVIKPPSAHIARRHSSRVWQDDPTMMDLLHGFNHRRRTAAAGGAHGFDSLSSLDMDHAGPAIAEESSVKDFSALTASNSNQEETTTRPRLMSSTPANRSSAALPPQDQHAAPLLPFGCWPFPLPPNQVRFSDPSWNGSGPSTSPNATEEDSRDPLTTTMLPPLSIGVQLSSSNSLSAAETPDSERSIFRKIVHQDSQEERLLRPGDFVHTLDGPMVRTRSTSGASFVTMLRPLSVSGVADQQEQRLLRRDSHLEDSSARNNTGHRGPEGGIEEEHDGKPLIRCLSSPLPAIQHDTPPLMSSVSDSKACSMRHQRSFYNLFPSPTRATAVEREEDESSTKELCDGKKWLDTDENDSDSDSEWELRRFGSAEEAESRRGMELGRGQRGFEGYVPYEGT